jgi:PAS domain S-box-containing protein
MALVIGRKKDNPLARYMAVMLWLETAWAGMLIIELLSRRYEAKLFWDNLQFPASMGIPFVLFMFANKIREAFLSADNIGKKPVLGAGIKILVFLPVIASAVLAFTDHLHGLLRISPFLDSSVPLGELTYGYTFTFYLLYVYAYVLMTVAITILLQSYALASTLDRRKYRLVIFGFLVPILGNIPAAFDVAIFGRRDLSPLWFIFANIPIILALFRFHLFSIVPRARQILLENLGDPVLVFDTEKILIDCNRAFVRLVGKSAWKIKGRSAAEILHEWPAQMLGTISNAIQSKGGEGAVEGIVIPSSRGDRYFNLKTSPVPGGAGNKQTDLCTVAILNDVTELTAVELMLRDWNTELEGRILSRIKDLEQEVTRRKAAEEGLRSLNVRIVDSQRQILVTLAEVLENRSPETANHVLRVGEYARTLATAYGLSSEHSSLIADAAPMHDVGKIGIKDSILNKDGLLTEDEMTEMKTHTTIGYRILGSSGRSIMRTAAVIALEHHERWNGEGYPAGKAEGAISLSGRIVCICDVFDALATVRPYKKSWEIERIIEYISSESGRMFDPRLVELFLANQKTFKGIMRRYPDTPVPGITDRSEGF